jgi:hypothetical protein
MGHHKPPRPEIKKHATASQVPAATRLTLSQDRDAIRRLETFAIKTLGLHAQAGQWSEWERKEAINYLDSLLRGDGVRPRKIAGFIGDDVEIVFAIGCKRLQIPDNTVIGQQQVWYRRRYNRATLA